MSSGTGDGGAKLPEDLGPSRFSKKVAEAASSCPEPWHERTGLQHRSGGAGVQNAVDVSVQLAIFCPPQVQIRPPRAGSAELESPLDSGKTPSVHSMREHFACRVGVILQDDQIHEPIPQFSPQIGVFM